MEIERPGQILTRWWLSEGIRSGPHRLLLLLALMIPAPAPAGDLTVFAASSLTAAFREIGSRYDRVHPGRTEFNFAGTQALRTQLENGARADLFAAAATEDMDRAVAAGLVAGEPRVFARNRLLLIVPRDDPGRVGGIGGLGRSGVRLVIAHAGVPVGRYTLEMLENLARDPAHGPGYRDAVSRNVVSLETSVRQVLTKVVLGEADAGVVYVSDVSGPARGKVTAFGIPGSSNVEAAYPIAVVASSDSLKESNQFIAFLLSTEGQAILEEHGFLAAGPSPRR